MKITSIVRRTAIRTAVWCKDNSDLIMKGAAIAAFVVLFSHPACAQGISSGLKAGENALTESTAGIQKYLPLVRNLIYAIAGIVAVLGGISVYIKMNNEEQDVKNILVLQNWLERIRKEVTNKVLSIKRISDFLIFPILAQPTLKKI